MASEDFEGVRLATEGDIPYKLIDGFPKYSESIDGVSADEEYIIRASDLSAFLAESLPRTSRAIAEGTTGQTITIVNPRTMPGRPDVFTVTVSAEPLNLSRPVDPDGNDAAAKAETYGPLLRVHIAYEAMSADFFRSITRSGGAEYLQIPPSNAFVTVNPNGEPVTSSNNSGQYQAESTVANKDPLLASYKVIPTTEWCYKLKPFSDPQFNVYALNLGKVNDRASTLLCGNADFETVMFTAVSATRLYVGTGLLPHQWDIDLKFSERQINDSGYRYGWNHVYSSKTNAGKGGWTRLERAPIGSGKNLYERADLAANLLTATVE